MDKLTVINDVKLQHVRRAVYQAGIWTTSTQIQLTFLFPYDFAWPKLSDPWVPFGGQFQKLPERAMTNAVIIKFVCY